MEKLTKAIYVTQPELPPIEEFQQLLQEIWQNKILTNNGPFHQKFEKELAQFLGVKYLSLFSNGTIALITALQALNIKGEVITTPFSFVATTHSLWWNNIKPVFVDIESNSFNLDPEKIEHAITPNTTAIMPVHVYGNPCNVEKLQLIAEKYKLKLIYDAAHAFGVKINGKSILNYGDLSILSFHATKVFNTIESVAIICPDEKTKLRIDYLKNFGFTGETTVIEPGINGKMNEIQSAFGLLQLKYIDHYILKRKALTKLYISLLKDVKGIILIKGRKGIEYNYAYFPILIDSNQYYLTRDALYEKLKSYNIYGRRYFYPLISSFSPYSSLISSNPENLKIAEKISKQVICLPIYPSLTEETIMIICNIIKGNI
ncbi:DegT/DnrJ/EryC1/StrS family aminotransferase [Bacteroidota bacterium]